MPGSPTLPRGLILMFAIASGLSVANIYYAQPLLDALAREFEIPGVAIGGVVTATQIGSAFALVFLVPLGDMMDRRRLMSAQLSALVAALLAVVAAPSATWLFAAMLGVGLLGTAMTQGLIAYAASAASPQQRGSVVGTAQCGVFVGLLLARAFSGVVSDLAGWRAVYLASAAAMTGIGLAMHRWLPVNAPSLVTIRYFALLRSMPTLLFHERTLQVRGVLGMLMFAAFSIFWTALVLPLSAPPFSLSHTAIGALRLVGAAGALAGARAGHLADDGHAQRITAGALILLAAAWWPLSRLMGHAGLELLVVGIVLLDVGGQALHVTNQSLIFRALPEAHSRMVGLYMLFYAAGSGLGAIGTTAVYAHAGWQGVCTLGFTVCLMATAFWAVTRAIGKPLPPDTCR
ncbi:putative MFS family arabinose efflux permease [Cupriavidus agavae]|uniref:Putative MFS family arabinose efflux permease n=1 Tax=Cupriavidus agavae TaxID=1001822 RepID=A0A4Q7RB35_9BURK|nr:putative MFS family arabinose efflux permease [Cupriavidus agavae]